MIAKKIFITGGNGFLGRHIIPLLKKNNYIFSPNSNEVNLLKFDSLKKINKKFDEIYHLAAWTEAGDFCLKNQGSQWNHNQLINTNIIKWWSEYQKKAKLIFIGSSCCYSEKGNLKEDNFINDVPHSSLLSYAMTKKMLALGAKSWGEQLDLKWIGVVPPTLYGINYYANNRQSHFIFDLIKKILRGKIYNEKVILWGNGFQRREIMHVEDFAKNIIKLNSKTNREITNVGYIKDYSIKEFSKIICGIIGYDPKKIFYDRKKYVGVKSKKLNIQKVKKIIPDYQKKLQSIETGIKQVVEWYVANKIYNI
jgi:GDP-L-fucose synthase